MTDELRTLAHLIDARRNLRKAKKTSVRTRETKDIEVMLTDIETILSEHLGDYSVERGAASHE